MDDINIYDDVANVDLGSEIFKLEQQNKRLLEHIHKLERDIEKLCTEMTNMKQVQNNLSKNISELFKTAKMEIERKDRIISELRDQIDSLILGKSSIPRKNYKRHLNETESDITLKKFKSNVNNKLNVTDDRSGSLKSTMEHVKNKIYMKDNTNKDDEDGRNHCKHNGQGVLYKQHGKITRSRERYESSRNNRCRSSSRNRYKRCRNNGNRKSISSDRYKQNKSNNRYRSTSSERHKRSRSNDRHRKTRSSDRYIRNRSFDRERNSKSNEPYNGQKDKNSDNICNRNLNANYTKTTRCKSKERNCESDSAERFQIKDEFHDTKTKCGILDLTYDDEIEEGEIKSLEMEHISAMHQDGLIKKLEEFIPSNPEKQNIKPQNYVTIEEYRNRRKTTEKASESNNAENIINHENQLKSNMDINQDIVNSFQVEEKVLNDERCSVNSEITLNNKCENTPSSNNVTLEMSNTDGSSMDDTNTTSISSNTSSAINKHVRVRRRRRVVLEIHNA